MTEKQVTKILLFLNMKKHIKAERQLIAGCKKGNA